MLALRFLLFLISIGALLGAVGLVVYDVFLALELDRLLRKPARAVATQAEPGAEGASAEQSRVAAPPSLRGALPRRSRRVVLGDGRWKTALKLVGIAAVLSLAATSLVVVPDGEAGVRISQLYGVVPGTLYPGTHFVTPLVDRVQLYDIRDRVFETASGIVPRERFELLSVESREGLSIGIGIAVRYRIDPKRLDYIQANLPQPLEDEIVEPVVTSAFRELAPTYVVRDIFSTKREEFRELATKKITARLAQDGIDVKEVLLRKITLPQEYAQGLEGLLLKEQQDDQMTIDTDIQQKQVKIAELQAEAEAKQREKQAEGDAQSKVIEAKGEADAMQYTLPLKQKQIEQTKLEAEARKEATIQNAQAVAEAKVIDSKAELQRRNLLADAEASRIKLIAAANAERMTSEAELLNKSPLLINKIVAERLSDKIQVVMVPSDGKFFFANDVFKNMANAPVVKQEMDQESEPDPKSGH